MKEEEPVMRGKVAYDPKHPLATSNDCISFLPVTHPFDGDLDTRTFFNEAARWRLEHRIAERGFTRETFAGAMGKSKRWVDSILNRKDGTARITKDNLRRICNLLDCTPDYLRGFTRFPHGTYEDCVPYAETFWTEFTKLPMRDQHMVWELVLRLLEQAEATGTALRGAYVGSPNGGGFTDGNELEYFNQAFDGMRYILTYCLHDTDIDAD